MELYTTPSLTKSGLSALSSNLPSSVSKNLTSNFGAQATNLGALGTNTLSNTNTLTLINEPSAFTKKMGALGAGASLLGGVADIAGMITSSIFAAKSLDEQRKNREMIASQQKIENERYDTLKQERDAANAQMAASANLYQLPTQRD